MDKLTVFIKKHSNTLNFEDNVQLKQFWQNSIAPSCVNRVMVFGGMDAFYECFICQKRLLYQSVIVRHYREQHAAQMPKDIFGATDLYECKVCDVKFKRDSHFKAHLASTSHLQCEDNAFQIIFNKNLLKRDRDDADDELIPSKKMRIDNQSDATGEPSVTNASESFFSFQEAIDYIDNDDQTDAEPLSYLVNNIKCENNQMYNDCGEDSSKDDANDDDLIQRYFRVEQFIIQNARAANKQNKLVKSLSSDLVNKLSF